MNVFATFRQFDKLLYAEIANAIKDVLFWRFACSLHLIRLTWIHTKGPDM